MQKQPSMLRDLAHELRDALSPIRAAVDLLRIRGLDLDSAEAVTARIDRGLDNALATIDAFVLAERYESGTAAPAVEPVAMQELLERAAELLGPTSRTRCTFVPAPAMPVSADVDASRRALTAMFEHALAATPAEEGIEVRAAAADGQLLVRVRLGAGTVLEESWFESFRARAGGSRLSLRAARRILQLQQGDLTLDTHGKEKFLVASFAPARAALPASVPEAAPAPRAASAPGAVGARVVIVDDSQEVRRAYREGLARLGYEVHEAKSAEAMLQDIERGAPDVAVVDIHLPGMNGYQLAQALKARFGATIKLVMSSGMTLDPATQRLSKSAGFDQCFDKAAGPRALHALLQRLL
jgi:CheY-like chemotaxis protein